MTRLLFVFLMILSVNAFANDKPWLDKHNPQNLHVKEGIGGPCPVTFEELSSFVDKVFNSYGIRSDRIIVSEVPYLAVDLYCNKRPSSNEMAIFVDVSFKNPREGGIILVYEDDYVSLGIQYDQKGVLSSVQQALEIALKEYRNANPGEF